MRTTYDEADDILVLHLSDKHTVKEVSQDWNTHISYAGDGTITEIVILDASKQGGMAALKEPSSITNPPAPLRAAPAGAPEAYHALQITHAQNAVKEPVARGNEEGELSERS